MLRSDDVVMNYCLQLVNAEGVKPVFDVSEDFAYRMHRGEKTARLLQLEYSTNASGVFKPFYQSIDCWPGSDFHEHVYDHFSSFVDRWGSVVSFMQPYSHVLKHVDMRHEIDLMSAAIALTGGPLFGFIGVLSEDFSWHINPSQTIVVVHTLSPVHVMSDFMYLLYYHFDSYEAAWRFLASNGKDYSDRILYYDDTDDCGWDTWWRGLYECDWAMKPWVVTPGERPVIFNSKLI